MSPSSLAFGTPYKNVFIAQARPHTECPYLYIALSAYINVLDDTLHSSNSGIKKVLIFDHFEMNWKERVYSMHRQDAGQTVSNQARFQSQPRIKHQIADQYSKRQVCACSIRFIYGRSSYGELP
jgi:hypothetical protein